ncbi:hypothetical protein TIFTF001_017984 [Ficus carica]|uniref:Uncharacterized protein n=1 Tax=Ficus carica TaxID=3494 RepID=A0AA88AAA5_FICCA|nr:hypothetical protein TIFTF001_017984 [Ficus carica]
MFKRRHNGTKGQRRVAAWVCDGRFATARRYSAKRACERNGSAAEQGGLEPVGSSNEVSSASAEDGDGFYILNC